ncbi:MAG: anhydro-N-acetylmuramic acid kinase [Legionellaceae bacterium]|nr:anhydro-N-acetylmuramic acid kinase [Legionellaceae bacterium]
MGLYIGLMSGTSMDGIDAALVDFPSHQCLHSVTYPYPPAVYDALQVLTQTQHCHLSDYARLHVQVGWAFSEAVRHLLTLANRNPAEITAIGSHGQTILHAPSDAIPHTLQIGCAHHIAQQTGIAVVADFRARDLALGGQGAPLAPVYHQVLFASEPKPLAVLNFGGIANISYLYDSGRQLGYDVGPANALLDAWATEHGQGRYDVEGQWAARGQVIPALLKALLDDPYFHQAHPKSIGKEYFSLAWLHSFLTSTYRPEDVQATLVALTVALLVCSAEGPGQDCTRWIVCGGGVHNKHLMQSLQEALPAITISSSAVMGISPDFVEAMMMAWLAHQAIQQQTLDLSSVTGSISPHVLGVLYPKVG